MVNDKTYYKLLRSDDYMLRCINECLDKMYRLSEPPITLDELKEQEKKQTPEKRKKEPTYEQHYLPEEILNLLRDNARISVEDISAMTKKSVEEVKSIIQQLENDGVIMKYAAIINPEKDSKAKEKVCAEIEIQVTPEREHGFDGIADRIYRFPQVKSLYLMSGGYDLKVIIEGETLQEVALFVARKLSTLQGVRSTKTHFILKTYKENDIVYIEENSDSREGAMA